MDWFSWLSRTNLENSLTYEYGLSFSHNELEYEDIAYFNHEFLQSMGISIAKHRLEILKLARRHSKPSPSISRVLIAIRKTGKCFSEYVRAMMRREEPYRALVIVKGRWSKSNKSNGNGSCGSSKEERLLLTNGTPFRLDSFSCSKGFDHYSLNDDYVYCGKNLQEEVIIKWDSMFQNLKPT
ncbi:Sterile alpha motif (SAM) domain-containing protein [Raphanus sativus]|nr:Sterile alpha motif (SAM) domain-containing protein [Raphanus sativus]